VSRPSTNYREPQWKPKRAAKQIIQGQECILGSVEQPVPVKEENLIPSAGAFMPPCCLDFFSCIVDVATHKNGKHMWPPQFHELLLICVLFYASSLSLDLDML
jgi:hypothetical protein